jgi:hypothetical protein
MNKQDEEEWKIISENKKYEVSNLAQIRNKNTKKIMKKKITIDDYEEITLCIGKRKTYRVHRLVAQAFIPNLDNFLQVNHKDRNKRNNRVSNLEWVTNSMNIQHSVETGVNTYKRAVRQRNLEGNEVAVFDSIKEASKEVKCAPESISRCASGKIEIVASSKWEYVKRIKEEAREDIPWKEIDNYSNYRIYNNGQIYGDYIKKYLTPSIVNGYYRVSLWRDNIGKSCYIHRLVAQLFCDNSDNKPIVNHRDGNKLNNHYTNLEWVTCSENNKHAYIIGLKKAVKRVNQYAKEDKDKRVPLRAFNNLEEAAESVKFKSKGVISTIKSNISMACTGKRKTAYGYKWDYL